jgi:putative nucleotidyltransferase with HDIG domain
MSTKIGYRIWQFWQSLRSAPDDEDWNKVRETLSPEEYSLFQRLPIPDQNHSIRVLKSLETSGESDPDLLKSALLHDIGKTKHPLRRWERVFVVLIMAIFPTRYLYWSNGSPSGWKRSLVIISRHPYWGADLAEETGSPPRVVWIIRNHESLEPEGDFSQEDLLLLRKLQKADNQN